MNIADSADYNGVICYILLKPHISFAIQQIIWESVDYEHNWERKREGYFNCFFTGYLLALRLAFYTRDIRGGLGERRTGRIMFQVLAKHYANVLIPNLPFIAEFGRWDDLIYLLRTPVEAEVISLLSAQLEEDCSHMLEGKPVSLLAKWLPSVNASSRKTRRQAKKLASAFGMSEKQYRKVMSQLRAYINVTERNLSMSAIGNIPKLV